MYGPDIVINIQPIIDFFSLPADILFWKLFLMVGWIPFTIVFIWGGAQVWLTYIRNKWYDKQKQVLLAIDIPRGNMQTPKAVENIFSYLAGMHGTYNYQETWQDGEFQLSTSLEIVSIDGYIQFLIKTFEKFKGIIETGIYSQYPDAEITEVEDYVGVGPSKFPDDQYDIWGGEFIEVKHSALPIKTYLSFEDTQGKPEVQYKDTMAALMDLFSDLRKGEQAWYQIILTPIDASWSDVGEEVISEIVGEKIKSKKNIVDKTGDFILELLDDFGEFVWKLWGDVKDKDKEEDEPFKMMNLKPRQKKQVEAIQEKVGKLCFDVKIRFIYLAKKELFNKAKVANGFVGFMKQFQHSDLNSFKPDTGSHGTATKINYKIFYNSRLNKRKRKIMKNYKNRDDTAGRKPMTLNIEELATIWHFPIETVVKAPLIQKAAGRKVEPPSSLPFSRENVDDNIFKDRNRMNASDDIFFEKEEAEDKEEVKKGKDESTDSTPSNLPFV